MTLARAKPTSPGRRFLTEVVREGICFDKPKKSLIYGIKRGRGNGRNNTGRVTVRHRGGGCKRYIRIVDFKRTIDDVRAEVMKIEYDPCRSAYLALLKYENGKDSYIIAPFGLKVGDTVISGSSSSIKTGNCLPLEKIPAGSTVHCVEMNVGKGAVIARSAGSYVNVIAHDGAFTIIRTPSGEMRKVHSMCRATLGKISNAEHFLRSLGKAGKSRLRGIRPTIRGVAMNPVDHPHGGGEGRTSGGRHPVSPTGKPTKGHRTRNRKKHSSRLIMKRRYEK